MSKKERTHFVRVDLLPDYEDERHELGAQNKDRFAMRQHAFDATDIDDTDSLIDKWYKDV
jgi:hypothetical protein